MSASSASSAPLARRLRSVARAILPFPEPESWLDVGTGDARFPEAARQVFPYTSFDGLDPTPVSNGPAAPNASRRPTWAG